MKLPRPVPVARVLSFAVVGAVLVGACGGTPPEAAAPPGAQASPGCGLALDRLSLYQGVEVVLAAGGAEVRARDAPVIAGRPAMLRVFAAATTPGVAPGEVTATLELTAGGHTRRQEVHQSLAGPPAEADLASTLNFQLPADDLAPDTELALELATPACAAPARFPAAGRLPVGALATGTLKVRLVPVRYDADGSGRLPDLSPAQLARLDGRLRALYPVADVVLSQAPPMPTTIALGPRGGWSELLEALRDRRARDPAPADVYDFGLVAPAPSHALYCTGACISGLAYVVGDAGPGGAGIRVGVGLGYPGLATADVVAHELGHLHGRGHAPCGAMKDTDTHYPYAGGQTGGWGLDLAAPAPLRPPTSKDLMGYCEPRWISDYTYRALAARGAAVNGPAAAADAVRALPLRLEDARAPAPAWRVLLVDGAGHARWSHPAAGAPPGVPTPVQPLDDAGVPLATVGAWHVPFGDGETHAYWLPDLPPGAAALRIGAAAVPLPR